MLLFAEKSSYPSGIDFDMYIILLKFALPNLSKYCRAPEISVSAPLLRICGMAVMSSSVEFTLSVKQFLC